MNFVNISISNACKKNVCLCITEIFKLKVSLYITYEEYNYTFVYNIIKLFDSTNLKNKNKKKIESLKCQIFIANSKIF